MGEIIVCNSLKYKNRGHCWGNRKTKCGLISLIFSFSVVGFLIENRQEAVHKSLVSGILAREWPGFNESWKLFIFLYYLLIYTLLHRK
jgi:hypothetical protein